MTLSPHEARFPLAEGEAAAAELVKVLEGFCERIVVAGSVRRKKPDVGDVELLCVPKANDFGGDELDRRIQQLIALRALDYRLNEKGSRAYGPKNKLLVDLSSGIPLDVFSTTIEDWGMALFIRTGPAQWNIRAMGRFKERGMQGHAYAGYTDRNGQEHHCPEETDVFDALGWTWVAPELRT